VKLYTIGYGGKSPQEFLDALKEKDIKVVVDVRLRPDRSSMGVYKKANSENKGIQRLLADASIEYVSLMELGNVFLDYQDWRERYHRLLESAGELLTSRLTGIPEPFCLLCAEKRVTECHRLKIADYLVRTRGAEVEHLE
jgi:uncharacterized protein (DUF488 family)